jgi:hypothetical protein
LQISKVIWKEIIYKANYSVFTQEIRTESIRTSESMGTDSHFWFQTKRALVARVSS